MLHFVLSFSFWHSIIKFWYLSVIFTLFSLRHGKFRQNVISLQMSMWAKRAYSQQLDYTPLHICKVVFLVRCKVYREPRPMSVYISCRTLKNIKFCDVFWFSWGIKGVITIIFQLYLYNLLQLRYIIAMFKKVQDYFKLYSASG